MSSPIPRASRTPSKSPAEQCRASAMPVAACRCAQVGAHPASIEPASGRQQALQSERMGACAPAVWCLTDERSIRKARQDLPHGLIGLMPRPHARPTTAAPGCVEGCRRLRCASARLQGWNKACPRQLRLFSSSALNVKGSPGCTEANICTDDQSELAAADTEPGMRSKNSNSRQ